MNFDFRKIFKERRNILILVIAIGMAILFVRLFTLQIVLGSGYQDNYKLRVEKQDVIQAPRGNIYDRNGQLLAYNRLANAVTIKDVGTYQNDSEKNAKINSDLYEVITNIEKNGDRFLLDFGIYIDSSGEYVFRDEGTRRLRFKADIFGRSSISGLTYNNRLGIDEESASADEIMSYLCDRRYAISEEYPKDMRFKIATIRYRMGLNTYQKYISTTIAEDVSEKTVAYIMENEYRFNGIEIKEVSLRVYDNAECFANILGYTGNISVEEYEELSKDNDDYTLNDIVGKAGIEQYMNSYLMGKRGFQTVYVDSLGNLLETAELVEQVSGNDVYLSIDKDLTIKAYNLLERQIASILYSKIINAKEYNTEHVRSRDDILIPIYDVYFALVDNRVISISKKDNLSDAESAVFNAFDTKFNTVLSTFASQLKSPENIVYNNLPKEYQVYTTFLVKKLKNDGIFDQSLIEDADKNQKLWTSERMAAREYLSYAIEKGWINVQNLALGNKYVDTTETYDSLIDFSIENLKNDSAFKRTVYKYALLDGSVPLGAYLAILYDQGVLPYDENARAGLMNGRISPFDFMRGKIRDLSITPGQLALDPCSGSCVLMEPKTGELLAVVSYPGYDSNRLANNLDSEYYAYLNTNNASPLYNHATQERTAPGSTFKMISATAGLGEGAIDVSTIIHDDGKYMNVSNQPTCWIYPGSHGDLSLPGAIRDSCNYYFYEVGYRLAGSANYNDERGISTLSKYAERYGLGEKTGIEIEESESNLATQYPVMAAIGQSDHNFTTIGLARYVSSVAGNGSLYDLTLINRVEDKEGNVIMTSSPTPKENTNRLSSGQWNAIHTGMRLMVQNSSAFDGFPVAVAGKTGTAQQSNQRPNHALFVGYAPYDNPEIAIATRISFGYTSSNAAVVSKRILAEYFDVGDYQAGAGAVTITTNNRITD